MAIPKNYPTAEEFANIRFTSGCQGKIRYTSKRQARGALRVILKHHRDNKANRGLGPLEAYTCGICRGVHLGHGRRHALPASE